MRAIAIIMITIKVKKIISSLITVILAVLLSNFSYANIYSNNSIEIEVSSQRRSYDYGDNVGIDIRTSNKNRYAKLHYKILEIYSGGGFVPLNLNNEEIVIDAFGNNEVEVNLRDFFYKNKEDRAIDTHITFNNGYSSPNANNKADSGISKNNNYYHRKHTYNIGGHAYELTEAEYEEYKRYRNDKEDVEDTHCNPIERSESEQLEQVKSQINATLLVIIIIILVIIILILFIWFIIKSKGKSGYNYKTIVLILGISL